MLNAGMRPFFVRGNFLFGEFELATPNQYCGDRYHSPAANYAKNHCYPWNSI